MTISNSCDLSQGDVDMLMGAVSGKAELKGGDIRFGVNTPDGILCYDYANHTVRLFEEKPVDLDFVTDKDLSTLMRAVFKQEGKDGNG